MIDFIKFQFKEDSKDQFESIINELKEESITGFGVLNQSHDKTTYDIFQYPQWLKFHNLKIKVNKKFAFIEGSIHKFYNISISGQEHNYNDFPFSKIQETIAFLEKYFVNINEAKITKLEFGMNLRTEISPSLIIQNNVFLFNANAPTIQFNSSIRTSREYSFSNFDFKIYDKGKQYKKLVFNNSNILRIELRFKYKELNKLGIYKLIHLKNKSTYRRLFMNLLRRYKDLQIVDDLSLVSNKDDLHKLQNYLHQNFWRNHLGEEYHSQQKKREKLKIEELLKSYDLNTTKSTLRDQLRSKYIYLIFN